MSYKQINNRPVFLVGDLHINYKEFKEDYDKRGIKNCDFIFLGDTTIIRERDFNQFKKLDKMFEKDCNKGYFLRGNHDNPYLHTVEHYKKHYNNFLPLQTGLIAIDGKKGIIVNGAVTINRFMLNDGEDIWLEYDKIDDCSSIDGEFDFVIGHTGPLPSTIVWNNDCNRFILEDKQLALNLANEQAELRALIKKWKPKLWCCGHYHSNYVHTIHEKGFECVVHIIDKNVTVDFTKLLCQTLKKN